MRVRSSLDAGATWSKGFLVARGPAAYSDLVALPGGVVGVLFETGDQRADERIDFATFGTARLDRRGRLRAAGDDRSSGGPPIGTAR